jgi:Leucine-rich repeat (LRR) protein
MPNQNGKLVQRRSYQKLPWMHANVNFPASLFPCHYIASNGKIILLSLFNLGLSEMPTGIFNLKSLTYFNFNSNNISKLPKSFSNLESLGTLFLNDNQFNKVPDILIELPRLQNLYMRNNKISRIPVTLTEAWQAHIGDPNYPPGNLIFSGNPIDRSSLSQEQLELEQKSLLNMHRHLYFVID